MLKTKLSCSLLYLSLWTLATAVSPLAVVAEDTEKFTCTREIPDKFEAQCVTSFNWGCEKYVVACLAYCKYDFRQPDSDKCPGDGKSLLRRIRNCSEFFAPGPGNGRPKLLPPAGDIAGKIFDTWEECNEQIAPWRPGGGKNRASL